MTKKVFCKLLLLHITMSEKTYYQRNRDRLLNIAKDYYENDKERFRKQARHKYRNLSEKGNKWEEKMFKKQI